MTADKNVFDERLAALQQPDVVNSLTGIKHGVEREALRIQPQGGLAQTPHPASLGSALTHDSITTDFSESLLEFITPPESDVSTSLAQLADVHKYVQSNIADERLWPLSMPCFISDDDHIPIAHYGSSNVARMKSLYRVGLKNRYGAMMQAISGVHFNFSLPDNYWQHWLATQQIEVSQDSISAAYFALLRNYRRLCWIIPYLYGASPALCGSFLQGRETSLAFKKLAKGSFYLPYATSLRMSDLGYTSSAQSDLPICYNQMESYIRALRTAMNTACADYRRFEPSSDGELQQLNSNILQIENELYSPIRPKQPALPLEKPTDALQRRGVSYIEVRALDVNPYSELGIEAQQFYFLDVFLLYCAIAPSPMLDKAAIAQTEQNLVKVVKQGRDPALQLINGEQAVRLPDWGQQLFSDMQPVAAVLDQAYGNQNYTQALNNEWQKLHNPDLTTSGRMLQHMLDNDIDNGAFGLQLAEDYRQKLLEQPFQLSDEQHFKRMAEQSLRAQRDKEQADDKPFEQFLADYFAPDAKWETKKSPSESG